MLAVQRDIHCFTGLSSSSNVFIIAVSTRVPGNITDWMQWEELKGSYSLSRSWARCKCKIGKSFKSWKWAVQICGYVQGFPLLPREYILPSRVTLRHKIAPDSCMWLVILSSSNTKSMQFCLLIFSSATSLLTQTEKPFPVCYSITMASFL